MLSKKSRKLVLSSSRWAAALCFVFVICLPQPFFHPLPLPLIARGVNIYGIYFYFTRCADANTVVEQMVFCSSSSPRVFTSLYVFSFTLPIAFSLARAFIHAGLVDRLWCLSFLLPFFLFSNRFSFHLAPCLNSRSSSSHVSEDENRSRERERGREREWSSTLLPPPTFRTGISRIPEDERQLRYSHSRPTCRIIRNSPAKRRIAATSSVVLDKNERIRSRVTSLRYCERARGKVAGS